MFFFPAFSAFFVIIALMWLSALGGFVLWVAALISISKTPTEAFGPWWDNTKQLWLIGLAVAFVVPLGTLIGSILWFSSGRAPLRDGEAIVGRPFWSGPPKPPPPPGGWPGYAQGPVGYPPVQPAWPGYPPPPAAPPMQPPASG